MVDPGNLVKADETALTSIVSLDPMYVYFDIDERTILNIRRLIADKKMKSRQETEIPVLVGLSDEARLPPPGDDQLQRQQGRRRHRDPPGAWGDEQPQAPPPLARPLRQDPAADRHATQDLDDRGAGDHLGAEQQVGFRDPPRHDRDPRQGQPRPEAESHRRGRLRPADQGRLAEQWPSRGLRRHQRGRPDHHQRPPAGPVGATRHPGRPPGSLPPQVASTAEPATKPAPVEIPSPAPPGVPAAAAAPAR